MTYTDLFVSDSLPRKLNKNELYDYFKKYKQGDLDARRILIEHNIRLVIYEVRKFPNTIYERKELVSVGLIGLIKSVDNFDITKNFEFSTFANKCINNEIIKYLRKENKHYVDSFEKEITYDGEGDELKLEGTIWDYNIDLEIEYENKEIRRETINIINSLSGRDSEVIKLYFGFYDRPYNQEEISKIIGVSRPNISKIIKRNLQKIKNMILSSNTFDISDRTKIKTTKK